MISNVEALLWNSFIYKLMKRNYLYVCTFKSSYTCILYNFFVLKMTTDVLSNEWVLRYDSSSGSRNKDEDEWKNNLKVIASISTVQDFWGLVPYFQY